MEAQLAALEAQVNLLANENKSLRRKIEQHDDDIRQNTKHIVRAKAASGGTGGPTGDVRRAEWKIPNVKDVIDNTAKGKSIWSPEFSARGLDGFQIEFFPNGRESTDKTGFCAVFLWAPEGSKVRYQFSVGSYVRAPDEDVYDGRMGHGHSNFCQILPEIGTDGSVTIGVELMDIELSSTIQGDHGSLTLLTGATQKRVHDEVALLQNRGIERVEWRITNCAKKFAAIPRETPLYSPSFSACGVREIILEFYPSGAKMTGTEGNCGFYFRCPCGTNLIVTLFVGKYKKGPIKAVFDGINGKGLPDFCNLASQIVDDEVIVGLELQNKELDSNKTTLFINN